MLFTAKQFHNAVQTDASVRSYYARAVAASRGINQYSMDANRLRTQINANPASITLKDCRAALRTVINTITDRRNRDAIYEISGDKWLRPWDVVPELKNFVPPCGDFGVGIEVEHDFNGAQSETFIARRVKNWKYIAMDCEGGMNGIEVTFAPTLYSKFGARSQAMRYLKLLKENPQHTRAHEPGRMVGTHVNVSVPRTRRTHFTQSRVQMVSNIIRDFSYRCAYPSYAQDLFDRYFNRHPYGYGYHRGKFVEWKLFNSVEEPAELRKYVEVAVSLTRLVASGEALTTDSVFTALEEGYKLACRKNKTAYTPVPQEAIPVDRVARAA